MVRCCLTSLVLALALPACVGPDDDTGEPVVDSLIGTGDGTPGSVGWEYILGPDENLDDPRDLGFDGAGNLWIATREDDRTFIVSDPGTADQDHDRRKDGDAAANHFMEEVSAFSFDGDVQFGSCGESNNTYNDQAEGNDYMGPVLWSTDLDVFGEQNPIGLGSHLDMTHETPFCVGIAWEVANVYWVFDGNKGNLVRNDFARDHGIGQDEHFDQVIHRFTEPDVARVEEAPGHLVLDHATNRLYAADTGNGRVLWLDITSGEEGASLATNDPGAVELKWEGADWGELATGFDAPGGLALFEGHLYVGDWGTGVITELELDGTVVRTLDTGFGPEALYGIEVGPDDKLWVIDIATGVYRIDP
jgi:DNA-binding beta-propeller fold protein YncE